MLKKLKKLELRGRETTRRYLLLRVPLSITLLK